MTRHSMSRNTLHIVGLSLVITLLADLTALAQGVEVGQTTSNNSVAGPHGGAQGRKNHVRSAPASSQFALGRPPGETVGFTTSGSKDVNLLPPVLYPTGGYEPKWATIADVNGDGKPDLIVANYTSDPCCYGKPGAVSVLVGNGDGTFQAPVTYQTGGALLQSVTVADVNNDGKLDILAANGCGFDKNGSCTNEGSVGVLLGNGDGTFRAAVDYDSGGYPWNFTQVLAADVNGDGKADLVVVNGCASACDAIGPPQGSVGVLLGMGDGTFRPPVVYSSGGYYASSLAVADLNGDGKPDFVVTNECGDDDVPNCSTPGPVEVFLGNGDGTFQAAVTYSSGGASGRLALADVNGDGKLDLVVTAHPVPYGGGYVAVLLGRGDGTFETATPFGEGNYFPLALADINGDGRLDLVVGNTSFNCSDTDSCLSVLLGNGDGSFQNSVNFVLPTYAASVAVADLNGDGKLDVVVPSTDQNDPPGTVAVLLNGTSASEPTHTTLASSLNPSKSGQAITFTATVSSDSGTPTGTVVFYDGSASLGSATLANGIASLSTSSLAVGSHSVTAAYQGSNSFAASTSAPLVQVVNPGQAPTTTSVASSHNPCVHPCYLTFTATVTSSSGTPDGTIVFFADSTEIGSATLSGGIATLTYSSLHHGTHPIIASYQGSADFSPSTSPVLNQVVYERPFATHTQVFTSGSPSFVGQPVTFIADVEANAGPGVPGGETVAFSDGNKGIGTAVTGAAYITISSLSPGRHTIFARYFGDGINLKSHGRVTQFVVKYPTTTTVVSSLNPAVYGQPITYTVTVTSSSPNPLTGKVKLADIGSLTLVNGVASITKNQVRVGTHALTAEYLGDDFTTKSTSQVLEQVVNPASTTTTIASSTNPSKSGQNVTFTATVLSSTGLDPYGTVTFTAGSTTLGTVALKDTRATVSTSILPVGSTLITATYSGSDGFTGSASSLTQVVQ